MAICTIKHFPPETEVSAAQLSQQVSVLLCTEGRAQLIPKARDHHTNHIHSQLKNTGLDTQEAEKQNRIEDRNHVFPKSQIS